MDEIDAIGGKRFSEGTSADREVRCCMGGLQMWWPAAILLEATWHAACSAVELGLAPSTCLQVQRTLMELLSQLDGFEKLGKVGRAGCAFCLLF